MIRLKKAHKRHSIQYLSCLRLKKNKNNNNNKYSLFELYRWIYSYHRRRNFIDCHNIQDIENLNSTYWYQTLSKSKNIIIFQPKTSGVLFWGAKYTVSLHTPS